MTQRWQSVGRSIGPAIIGQAGKNRHSIPRWHVLWMAEGKHGRSQSEEAVTGPGYEPSGMWTTRDPLDMTFGTQALTQNCQNRLLASSCLPVCRYARMEQLTSQWTDFH